MGIVVPASQGSLAVSTLSSALATDPDEACRIDLTHARFVEPAGLVAVAALVDRAQREGHEVVMSPPEDVECSRYLSRMRLGAFLGDRGVDHGLVAVTERDVDNLCELRWFGSEDELEQAAAVIVEQYSRAGSDVVQPLYDALFELGVNAVDHSGQKGGYVALQTFPNKADVAFAVADSGVGLRARIGGARDSDAIRLAARKYESSASGRGRGRGITGVIDLTNRRRGSVTFFTGDAQGDFTNGLWDPRVTSLESPYLGTLVSTRLSQKGER